ncbi:MAG: hypothetical protein ILM98_01670 [Kiritimatiellae bacterium]|nr:hypothetical protein [Kiritimatiellia bacterium]
MEKLLRQLEAHRSTADPWILVYDNRGTFSESVGNRIRICNLATGASQLFGIPVRTTTYVDYRGAVVLETRVERAELPALITRVETAIQRRLARGA